MAMEDIVRKIAEKCSRADVRVNDLDLVHLRPYIEGFLDSQWLESQLCDYNAWASKNSDDTLRRTILHRPLGTSVLIAMIWAARSWEHEYRSNASLHPDAGAKSLLNIACNMAVLERHAPSSFDHGAREYVRQRLQAADNFVSLVHEINTAAYFIRKGAVVKALFLKKANREEILVHWAGQCIPIQCKAKPPRAGRLISQDTFTTLAGSIAVDAKRARRSLLVRIGTTGPIRAQDFDFLRSQVSNLRGRYVAPVMAAHDGRVFSVEVQPISGIFTVDSVRDYLSSFRFHVGMVIGEPAPGGANFEVACVIGIDATIDDGRRSSKSLRRSVEAGASQLKGGPLGIVAIHYADPILDFDSFSTANEPVFRKKMGMWPHVGAIMVSSEPDFLRLGMGGAGEVRSYVKESVGFADLLGPRITR